MDRFILTDAQRAKMEPICLGKASDPGRSGGDNRLFLEAVLWIARTGSPWRDLRPSFGKWNTVFKRYRNWVEAAVFKRIFDEVSEEPIWNMLWLMSSQWNAIGPSDTGEPSSRSTAPLSAIEGNRLSGNGSGRS